MTKSNLEKAEDGSSVVCNHFQQYIEVSTIGGLTVRSAESEREKV